MRRKLISLLVTLVLLLGAVAPAAAQDDTPTLRLGLLPILDALPFYVAESEGFFAEAGVEVELVPVASALERDQLVLAGEIDGMINDLISTGIFNQDEPLIQIVALGRRAYPDFPQYRILGAPRSNVTIPEDLTNVEIVISENSVIHYITQRILENAGVDIAKITYRAEPNIALRYQLLLEGTYKAATLPDPLAQAAIENGAVLVADDTALVESQFSQSVLGFRTEVIEKYPDAVEHFVEAWMRAGEAINADPEAYRDLWIENTNVPDDVRDSYVLPPFPIYELTTPEAWADAMDWMLSEEIIDEAPSYESSVTDVFIAQAAPTVKSP